MMMSWKNGEYSPKQKRAEETKARLLIAAAELFGTDGYHGTTAKAIAAKAGVATGSFYRSFRDKKAAFMAVCHNMEAEISGRVFETGRQMREAGVPESRILPSLLDFAIDAHRENMAFHKEVLAMQIMDADVAAWARAKESRIITALCEFMQEKPDAYKPADLQAAAELMFYVIEEICHRAIFFESLVGGDRLIQSLRDMLQSFMSRDGEGGPPPTTCPSAPFGIR